MSSPEQARQTQLRHIEAKTGQPLAALVALVAGSGLVRHGEVRSMLMARLGLGYGDANALAQVALAPAAQARGAPASATASDPDADTALLDGIYTGKKAALRPIHEAVMAALGALGSFEVAPKKGYLSLRRQKQFAMLGPASQDRVELGLNLKGVAGGERLLAQPAGGMCSHKVRLTDVSQVDDELTAWARQAFDAAG